MLYSIKTEPTENTSGSSGFSYLTAPYIVEPFNFSMLTASSSGVAPLFPVIHLLHDSVKCANVV